MPKMNTAVTAICLVIALALPMSAEGLTVKERLALNNLMFRDRAMSCVLHTRTDRLIKCWRYSRGDKTGKDHKITAGAHLSSQQNN